MLDEKAKLPPLGNDPASYRWKETQKNTNKQSVHSQVSAMNAATAQMVTLTGHGEETDHTSVGAAVKTISNNLPEMAKGIQMLAALMDDEGKNESIKPKSQKSELTCTGHLCLTYLFGMMIKN